MKSACDESASKIVSHWRSVNCRKAIVIRYGRRVVPCTWAWTTPSRMEIVLTCPFRAYALPRWRREPIPIVSSAPINRCDHHVSPIAPFLLRAVIPFFTAIGFAGG